MDFERFEDLPVWNDAIGMAVLLLELTEAGHLNGVGDPKGQIDRAAISFSNNVAEGFERETNDELLTFLYIARGSVAAHGEGPGPTGRGDPGQESLLRSAGREDSRGDGQPERRRLTPAHFDRFHELHLEESDSWTLCFNIDCIRLNEKIFALED